MGKTTLLCAAATLALAAAAHPVAPKREATVQGVPSGISQYDEKNGARLLYYEEKGGLVTPMPPPVPRAEPKGEERAAAFPPPAPATPTRRAPRATPP